CTRVLFEFNASNPEPRNGLIWGGAGAVLVWQSSATIEDCTFHANAGPAVGGGIWSQQADLELFRCVFRQNSSLIGSAGAGALRASGSLLCEDCIFDSNYAASGGAAVRIEDCDATFQRCCFMNNRLTRTHSH